MRAGDFVAGNVAYNEQLSPLAWEGNELRLPVRVALLKAAKFFTDYLDIPNFRVIDVVLTGSMANYNYTKYSDFDLHVITRYSDLECDDLAEAFYRAKKSIWNDDFIDHFNLENNLCHETMEEAIKHSEALLTKPTL